MAIVLLQTRLFTPRAYPNIDIADVVGMMELSCTGKKNLLEKFQKPFFSESLKQRFGQDFDR